MTGSLRMRLRVLGRRCTAPDVDRGLIFALHDLMHVAFTCGMPMTDIARCSGVDVTTVRQVLARMTPQEAS